MDERKFIEKSPEHIPTIEEIKPLFEQFVEGKEYKEERKLEDEKGIYLWEVRIPTEPLPGEEEGTYAVYSYARKGHFEESKSTTTTIHVHFFAKDDMPMGGHCVANFIDNKWVLTS